MSFEPYHTYLHERNFGCRLTKITLSGYRAVVLENNLVRATILVDKGTDIYELLYKPLDVDAMWRAPVGLRARDELVPPRELESGKMIDQLFGGWFEMFPNAGYHFERQGLAWGIHGELTLQAWEMEIVLDTPEEIAVRFFLRTPRTPFAIEKTVKMTYDQPALFFHERITNEGDQGLETSWGQHPCYGWPFIDDSSRLYVPPCRALTYEEILAPTTRFKPGQDKEWPWLDTVDGQTIDASRIPGPEARSQDHIYLTGFREGWYALTNERLGLGLGLQFDPQLFKYLVFWQVYRGAFDYPWWGTTYNIAVEPQTSYPNHLPEQIRAGNALHLEPGETIETDYLATFYRGTAPVTGINSNGKVTYSK